MGTLSTYLKKEQFNPGIAGLMTNPFFIARRGLYLHIKKLSGRLSGRLLDVGCGTKPYKDLFRVQEYIGLDIDTTLNREEKDIDVFYDGTVFPFPDHSFDSVLCNQVFEHVFNPEFFLKEMNRVLKPGGQCLVTVPFVWDEHEQPYDYARYSSFGLKSVFEKAGFRALVQEKSVNDLRVLVQLLNGYLYKKTVRHRILKMIVTVCVMFPIHLVGIPLGLMFPSNNDLYLDNILLAQKERDIS